MRPVGWMLASRERVLPEADAPRQRRSAGERGAALVEFSMILPILASLLMGVVTGGSAYHRKITMTDAVREGARFGATSENTSNFATAVRDRTLQLSSSELGTDNICVQLVKAGSPETIVRSWYPPSGGGSCPAEFGAPPASPTMAAGFCVVKVWSHRTARLEALFFNQNIDLTARAVAAYERGTTAGVC